MIQYYENGKFQPTMDSPDTYMKHELQNLTALDATFNPNTREGIQGLFDVLIYKNDPRIGCITERYLQKHIFRRSDKIELLQCMLESRSGLFEVTGTDMEEGYVFLREVLNGKEYKIIDISLSGSQNYGNFYLYARVITYGNVSFNSGSNLIFKKSDPFIVEFIEREKKDYTEASELIRFLTLYNHFTESDNGLKIVTTGL